MSEHYTRNTVAILKFCNTCNRMTMHKVSGKKIGLCMEDHHASKKPLPAKNQDVNLNLF